jgi:hypothetical protein
MIHKHQEVTITTMPLLKLALLALALTLVCGREVPAATSDNHTVTVTVNAINEISIAGGSLTLTINSATAGVDPNNDIDATTGLLWTSNEAGKKATIQTDLAAPVFTLKALATGVSGGTAAAELTVSTTAQDFITGIATTTGSGTIQYTGVATSAQGTGSDIHTITITIVDN